MSEEKQKGILKLLKDIKKKVFSKDRIIEEIKKIGENKDNFSLYEDLIPLLNDFKDEEDIIFALRETFTNLNITAHQMNELGIDKEDENDPDGAIHKYELAVTINPSYQWAFYNMGRMYGDVKKDYDKSIECYLKATKINKHYGDAWNNLGNIYSKLNRFSLAKQAYEKSYQSPTYNAKQYPYFNLGLLYDKVEQHNKAIEFYLKAIEIKKDYAKAYYNAAKSYKKLGQDEKCMDFFAMSLEIDGSFEKSIRDQGVSVEEIMARQLIKKLTVTDEQKKAKAKELLGI